MPKNAELLQPPIASIVEQSASSRPGRKQLPLETATLPASATAKAKAISG